MFNHLAYSHYLSLHSNTPAARSIAFVRQFRQLIVHPQANAALRTSGAALSEFWEVIFNLLTGWNPFYRYSVTELSDCLAKAAKPPQPKYIDLPTTSKCGEVSQLVSAIIL